MSFDSPAWSGAMSDMLATNPAWPSEVPPRATVMAVTATVGVMPGCARTRRATAGTKKAAVWSLRGGVAGVAGASGVAEEREREREKVCM